MAIAKTSTLLIALISGFVALILNSVAVGSPYWAVSEYTGLVREYFNVSGEISPRKLVRNRGLWVVCHYVLNVNFTEYDNSETINNGDQPVDAFLRCEPYNFTSRVDPSNPGSSYLSVSFYTEKCACVIACAALGMQFCAAMTSLQGAWTMLTVLFTDCGIMFLIGAFFSLLSTLFFLVSHIYGNLEISNIFPSYPRDYFLTYSWSFYLAWTSFGLTLLSGTLYLLIARAWHLEEVWVRAEVEKPGANKKEETVSSRRKLMGKL